MPPSKSVSLKNRDPLTSGYRYEFSQRKPDARSLGTVVPQTAHSMVALGSSIDL
jgi:hypothetical protein